MLDHETGSKELAACPKCGADATWMFTDREETAVEIQCADCGRISMARSEFDAAQADLAAAAPEDRER